MTSSVAAKFAFFPPNSPSYRVVVDDDGKMMMTDVTERENVDVLKLRTKKGTEIVAAYVKNPVAKLTLLYSHGNAADLGQMQNPDLPNPDYESDVTGPFLANENAQSAAM